MLTLPLPKHKSIEPWELDAMEWGVIACMAVTTPTKFAAYSMGVYPPSSKNGSYELKRSEAEKLFGRDDEAMVAIELINRLYGNRYAVLANNARAGKFSTVVSIEGSEGEYPIQKYVEFAHSAGWELPTQLMALLPVKQPAQPSQEKEILTNERNTMLRIIAALAVGGYKYPVYGSKAEMLVDFDRNGMAVDEKTLAKYLKQAKQYLPYKQGQS